jgi:hypothetical protein
MLKGTVGSAEKTFMAPMLTEDDAFNSNPDSGFITYRLPSLMTLMGVPEEMAHFYDSMEFTLSIQTDVLGTTEELTCQTSSKCRVRYRRPYTPVVYELVPPVVYKDSETLIYFDPKSTTSLVPTSDLTSDEMPFINAKIGGALLDFENSVDFDRTFSHYYRNTVKGRSGD